MSIFSVGGSTPSDGFELKSVRLDYDSDPRLQYPLVADPTSKKVGTFSWWAKYSKIDANQCMFCGYDSSATMDYIGPRADNGFDFYGAASGSMNYQIHIAPATRVFRDVAAWYHFVWEIDTTLGTAADRMKVYINGERITTAGTNPAQNLQPTILDCNNHYIGYRPDNSQNFGGYLAEFYYVDGQALGASYFGETNAQTGQWQPKEPKDVKAGVAFGAHGYYLPFSNDALATSITPTTASGAGTAHTFTPTETLSCDVLLVGGGGAGGRYHAGGGGAGGVVVGTGWSATASAHNVFVGAGGQSSTGWPSNPAMRSANGGNSSFLGQIAYGGGGGGSYQNVNSPNPYSAGNDGGSGGGADGGQFGAVVWDLSGGAATKGLLTLSGSTHGNVGGTSAAPYTHSAGGGGGAGGAGQNAAYPGSGGAGGAGVANSYQTGSNITYGGGGGGGRWAGTAGVGGAGGGGGGSGAVNAANGGDGTNGLGGGGGGMGGNSNSLRGGHGGSGVVIIRYAATSAKASGGTITSYTSGPTTYQVHTFSTANSAEDPVTTVNGDAKNVRINNHQLRPDSAPIIGPKVGSSAISFMNRWSGNGDYLSMPYSTDWNFGTGDFTIEWWMNSDALPNSGSAVPNNHSPIIGYAYYGNPTGSRWNGWGFAIREKQAGAQYLMPVGMLAIHTSVYATPDEDIQIPLYGWHHYAFVRQAAVAKVYVDGVLGSTWTTTSGAIDASDAGTSRNLRIGQFNYDDAYFGDLTAYIDEVRISNTARYTANFTPDTTEFSSDANTKLLIHSNTTMGSTTFTDSSSAGHTITAAGNVKHVAPKIGTGMATYNGISSQVETGDAPPDWALGTADFTWDFWAYADAWENNDCFFEAYAASNDYWEFRIKTNGDLALSSYVGGSHVVDLDWNSANMPTGAWVHVELSRSGSTFRCFINGTETGDAQTSSGSLGTAVRQLKIGRSGRLNTYFKGYIDELRISDIVRHTSNFTPSTTAHTPDINTMLLLHLDGGGGIDPVTNLPTLPGEGLYYWDASTDAIFYENGIPTNKSLISFDGSGDYLSLSSAPTWDITGDYTWECWVNVNKNPTTATAVHMQLMGQYLSSTDRNQLFLSDSGGVQMWLAQGGSSDWYGNTGQQFQPGVWYHIAASRASGTLRVFVNGTELFNASSSLNTNFTAPFEIGRKGDGSLYTNGKMDQIRISDNARYTTPVFTPTEALTVDALIVAGGGGGAGTQDATCGSGGGGAGGYRSITGISVSADTAYGVVVGAGGSAGPATYGTQGGDGGNSSFNTYSSTGGGGGGTAGDPGNTPGRQQPGRDGGSGGGAGPTSQPGGAGNTPSTSPAQGFAGGSTTGANAGAGGGGASEVGGDSSGNRGADGGDGIANSITGSSVTYAGGGGGGSRNTISGDPGTGGTGGGGDGNGTAGTANTGGGGGGNKGGSSSAGGAGGSGIVVIRYQSTTQKATGGTVTTYGSGAGQYYVHTFITTGQVFTPPTTPFETDANTKLLLQSDFSEGGLGADHSGNYNYFTPTNLTVNDSVLDSPMNNFATLDIVANGYNNFAGGGTVTFSQGNLKNYNQYGAAYWPATIELPTSGKWYWEAYADANSVKIGLQMEGLVRDLAAGSKQYLYTASGVEYPIGTTVQGTGYSSGDILGFAVNLDNGEIKFYKNNTLIYTGTNMNTLGYDYLRPCFYHTDGSTVWVNFGVDSSFAGTKTGSASAQDDNDKGDFYYAPPSGHLALCTDNLPTPSIRVSTKQFDTALYTGTGNALEISSLAFQPDFTWIKTRDLTYNHRVFDVVRGVTKELYTNTNNAEVTDAQSLKSFDSDGFTLGTSSGVNPSSPMVSWNWKGGGSASTNTDGDINTEVSSNTSAGFSIITYTGNGTSGQTIGHGLSQKPDMLISFNRDGGDPWVWHKDLASGAYNTYIQLNSGNAFLTTPSSGYFTSMSATTLTMTTGVSSIANLNTSGADYLLYAFHSVEGFSKIGGYVGNALADGTFIYTGFKPAVIITKSRGTNDDWIILDNKRDPYNSTTGRRLKVDSNTSEGSPSTSYTVDFVSNGAKIRTSYNTINKSNDNFLFLAFAESPFKTSNAR